MRKLKLSLILLLTAALLAGGAMLPKAAGFFLDTPSGAVSYAQLNTVEFDLGADETPGTRDALYFEKILARYQDMYTLPISPSEATLSEEDLFAAVEQCMQPYIDIGLFDWFEASYSDALPYMSIDPNDTENYGIFWTVNLVSETDPYISLFVHIDDATGCLLYIEYYNEYAPFADQDRFDRMFAFAHTYFQALDMQDMLTYLEQSGSGLTLLSEDESEAACRYSFGTMENGEINVEFHLYESGFYTRIRGV